MATRAHARIQISIELDGAVQQPARARQRHNCSGSGFDRKRFARAWTLGAATDPYASGQRACTSEPRYELAAQ